MNSKIDLNRTKSTRAFENKLYKVRNFKIWSNLCNFVIQGN